MSEQRDRILVVAYYFPPMGLSGVQRIAKFVRYLPDYGWDPTVLTVEPGGYFAFDASLMGDVEREGTEIVRTTSWDPTRPFGTKKTVGLPGESVRKRFAGLSSWLFVPDNKIGWYAPAVRAGLRLHRARPFDRILSTAPPYTGHLIGAALHRRTGVPLWLDFRDDWLGNPRHRYPTMGHRRLHAWLERRVVRAAAGAITINAVIGAALEARHPGLRVHVLPQGYDPGDFDRGEFEPGSTRPPAAPVGHRTGAPLRLLYSGVFYDAQQPDPLLQGIARLKARSPERGSRIELVFAGLFPESGRRLADRLGLSAQLTLLGYLAHQDAVAELGCADALWMIVGRQPGEAGISTGKLYEYFGSGKPILGLVPEGSARCDLERYHAAYIAAPDDVDAVADQLDRLLADFDRGSLKAPDRAFARQFDRRELTGRLDVLLRTEGGGGAGGRGSAGTGKATGGSP